jgi:hypothetical protein
MVARSKVQRLLYILTFVRRQHLLEIAIHQTHKEGNEANSHVKTYHQHFQYLQ